MSLCKQQIYIVCKQCRFVSKQCCIVNKQCRFACEQYRIVRNKVALRVNNVALLINNAALLYNKTAYQYGFLDLLGALAPLLCVFSLKLVESSVLVMCCCLISICRAAIVLVCSGRAGVFFDFKTGSEAVSCHAQQSEQGRDNCLAIAA